jgi:hypothetical protein
MLGMPVGTAEKHLRKSIIHELASQLGKNQCARCGQEIESPDDLAIIHVQDWENDVTQFWSLTNVAFSHVECEASRYGKRQREKKKMKSKVELKVLGSNGRSLPGTRHDGQLYVAGKRGKRYEIRIRNKTNKSVLVVLTVDGRNVTNGEPGDHHGPGHVLGPRSSFTFKGWRTSNDEVAAFEFGAKSKSYSAQMGTPENVGVIGVAVFEEEQPDPKIVTVKETTFLPYPVPTITPTPWYGGHTEIVSTSNGVSSVSGPSWGGTLSNGNSTGAGLFGSSGGVTTCSTTLSVDSHHGSGGVQEVPASSPVRGKSTQKLGTGWGETVTSKVRKVDFKRATDEPCEVHTIRYDSMKALMDSGIMRKPEKPQEAPQAFPENEGYCQPPGVRKRDTRRYT